MSMKECRGQMCKWWGSKAKVGFPVTGSVPGGIESSMYKSSIYSWQKSTLIVHIKKHHRMICWADQDPSHHRLLNQPSIPHDLFSNFAIGAVCTNGEISFDVKVLLIWWVTKVQGRFIKVCSNQFVVKVNRHIWSVSSLRQKRLVQEISVDRVDALLYRSQINSTPSFSLWLWVWWTFSNDRFGITSLFKP